MRFSATASWSAAYRAIASERDNPICRDPWARKLAGPEGFRLADAYAEEHPKERKSGLFIGLRTRIFDDSVGAAALAAPSLQVVQLASGLSTRAGRFVAPNLTHFEVDTPETIEEKKRRLSACGDYPEAARYVPQLFSRETSFLTSLEKAGFRRDQPALFLIEGLFMYLEEAAVLAVLAEIAAGCRGAVVVFDYVTPERVERQSDFMARIGEPFVWSTRDPAPLVARAGLSMIDDVRFRIWARRYIDKDLDHFDHIGVVACRS